MWTKTVYGTVVDEITNEVVCILPEDCEEEVANTIAEAMTMKTEIEAFTERVKEGKLQAKSTYNTFMEILRKIKTGK